VQWAGIRPSGPGTALATVRVFQPRAKCCMVPPIRRWLRKNWTTTKRVSNQCRASRVVATGRHA